MSLRGRLLIALIALLAGGLVVADVATFVALRSYLDNQVVQQLQQATSTVTSSSSTTVDHGGHGNDANDGKSSSTIELRGLQPGTFVQVRDANGAISYQSTSGSTSTTPLPAVPAVLPSVAAASTSASAETAGDVAYLTVPSTDATGPSYQVMVSAIDDGRTVVVAVPLNGMGETLSGLVRIEAIVSAVVLFLAAAIAWWMARAGLRPLDEISDAAADIAAGDLSRRVPRDDERTEIGRLGHSLNVMMGQIETAFAEQEASEARVRRFAADASHELRTPLAAVQAYAELFERGARDHPDDLPRLMHNIRKESARMAALLDDLLLLTRLDQGRPLDHAPVDVGAIAADAVEAARAVDDTRPITLAVDGSIEVRGDRLRLRQVVDNLLANVRVHTPPGTAVEVVVATDGDTASLTVRDHGPGLADAEQAHIFERFYRTDPARSRTDGGSGLGLSIVAAIAHAHRGDVAVRSTPGGGASFRIRLPLLEDVECPEPVAIEDPPRFRALEPHAPRATV